jgi:hypothetical protein
MVDMLFIEPAFLFIQRPLKSPNLPITYFTKRVIVLVSTCLAPLKFAAYRER